MRSIARKMATIERFLAGGIESFLQRERSITGFDDIPVTNPGRIGPPSSG